MEAYTDKLIAYGTPLALKILAAVAILALGRILVGIVAGVVGRMMERHKVEATLAKFLVSLTRIALMTFVIIAAIRALGVETTSFIAVIGAAGLAIGLALQGSLANLASGVMLILFRPFKVGDYVETGGTAGTVDTIHIFNTILTTPDNKKVILPNGKITADSITNYSAMDTRRIDLVFGIGYEDDLKKAKTVLEGILREDARILTDPAPTVAVMELGDSSINFVVRPWVKTADYWSVYFDINERVKLTFDREGISIPFPQRDVHLFQEKVG
ncbi:MAG: mechanosensitive ion channel [Acidobacteria bacterium]|nr:mechanosensitive ion channel [Acidobacteriota bacterium]